MVSDSLVYPGKGQDYLLSGTSSLQELAIAVLADGVSNSKNSEIGAKIACEEAFKSLNESGESTIRRDFYSQLYGKVVDAMDNEVINQKLSSPVGYATTLITAVIGHGFAEFSYCGNGAIFHIRSHWFDLPDELLLPWGINNYLNPHTLLLDGENKLNKSLKPGQEIIRRSPDLVEFASTDLTKSYFFICSDGLYTSDESLPFWDDSKTNIYHSENERLLLFLRLLRKFHDSKWENKDLFRTEFRNEVSEKKLLTDDLSYVLFIPA